MTETMPEPLDGVEYEDAAARVLAAWKAGLLGDDGARLVATVEATRRLVDELRGRLAPLDRLNRALAELGMPAAALTLTSGTSAYDMTIGLPVAVLRLVHADDPDQSYGVIRIQFPFKATTEGER